LDFLTHGYMIDNVMLVVTGALHERDINVSLSSVNSFWVINSTFFVGTAYKMSSTRTL